MSGPVRTAVLQLLADFALDVAGNVDGLTEAEFARAWWARYRTAAPHRTFRRMSEELEIRTVRRRECAIRARRVNAWVPGGLRPGRLV